MTKRLPIFIIFCVVFCFNLSAQAAGVLLLHSTQKTTAWTEGVYKGLVDEVGGNGRVVQEYLGDASMGDDHFEDFSARLTNNWNEDIPDVIVTDGSVAFAFVRKYHEDLFPDAPIVYCGMQRPKPELIAQCGECTGVPTADNIDATLDLIFRLRPETSMVVGIVDGQPARKWLRQAVEQWMERNAPQAGIIFPGHENGDEAGLDLESLRSVAMSAPVKGAVLFFGFSRDNQNKTVDEVEAVRLVADRSDAPSYVLSGALVHSGIIGTVSAAPLEHGSAVGRLVTRILAGESAAAIPDEPLAIAPIVDLTAMARFGLPERSVPTPFTGLNPPQRPESSQEIKPSNLIALFGAVGVVVVLVATGVVLRRRGER